MAEWIVTSQDSGNKLLTFLLHRLEGKYSARFLKRLIDRNACQRNGRTERFASTEIQKGDHICLHIEQASEITIARSVDPHRILFEDDVLFVYDKPAGMQCDEKGILHVLRKHNPNLQLVHRLDRDTTGVLLLTKNPESFAKLVQQFKQFQVRKSYQAIVDGFMNQAKGMIENYLGKKAPYAGQTIWGSVSSSRGLYAYTEWKKLKTSKTASLLACTPKTGRTHQIRVHLAGIGHPILGDFQYGKHFNCPYRPARILLHAEALSFNHPSTAEALSFKAPLPDDFQLAIQKLFR